MVQVAEGNEHALTRLYDGTNRMVYGLALRILGDSSAAEDVTLELYLQVWRMAKTYDPERGAVSSWACYLDAQPGRRFAAFAPSAKSQDIR